MTAEEHKNVVRGLIAALDERRIAALGDFLAADVRDHNKIIFGEPEEPGAAFEGFRRQLDALTETAFRAEELIAEGDRVVARLRVSGRHTGPHPRMPEPTGRRFDVEQIWIFTVTGGRVTEIRAVSDRLGMFAQLGWDWPEPERC
ncbi:ester cyclase [Sciscionella marina]|uniref:ester cyclase n=1 Tax=Sciscionella marina TaxID=508770 RepID=UPI000361B66F|nr:ester cyclase [Sciscionella marina]